MPRTDFTKPFTGQAERVLKQVYLPRIVRCLKKLSAQQVWWRPNAASNSVGNLVLHLTGNVRQWIVAGLGGATDTRERDKEFEERGPLPKQALVRGLKVTVQQACRVLHKLAAADLAEVHKIQGYRVTGLEASYHVAEHFAHHAGQIILITKLLTGRDLAFTHLPDDKKGTSLCRHANGQGGAGRS